MRGEWTRDERRIETDEKKSLQKRRLVSSEIKLLVYTYDMRYDATCDVAVGITESSLFEAQKKKSHAHLAYSEWQVFFSREENLRRGWAPLGLKYLCLLLRCRKYWIRTLRREWIRAASSQQIRGHLDALREPISATLIVTGALLCDRIPPRHVQKTAWFWYSFTQPPLFWSLTNAITPSREFARRVYFP